MPRTLLAAAGCLLASLAPRCSLAQTSDQLVMVTDSGTILSYRGGSTFTSLGSCTVTGGLRDIIASPAQAGVFYMCSATQIFTTTLSGAVNCNSPLLTGTTSSYDIAHIAADGNFVYFTERSSRTVRRVAVAGGADVTVVTDGADGMLGTRVGVYTLGTTILYTGRGVNASNTAQTMNSIFTMPASMATPPARLFRYGPNQQWWLTDLAISTTLGIFVGAELRNDSGTNNIQRSTWPLGNLNPLMTNIANANEDNTFVTLDEMSVMCWYTAAHTNELTALNATGRNAPPVLSPFARVPTSYGNVHGITLVRGTTRFDYCSSPVSTNPACSSGGNSGSPSASPSTGASLGPNAVTRTPSAAIDRTPVAAAAILLCILAGMILA